jgi:hypothetical protein
MSTLDSLADKVQAASERLAGGDGFKGKLAEELAEDADFLRKLKPTLIAKRVKGEAPTDQQPGLGPKTTPAAPQLGSRPARKRQRSGAGGGPNPFLVVGVALIAGFALAKWIDWRGHAHPKW